MIFISLLLLFFTLLPPVSSEASPEAHWLRPVPAQGRSVSTPQQCGLCHGDKLTQWSGSRHAQAFSPGLTGQLLESSPEEVNECLNCHAPLTEQQQQPPLDSPNNSNRPQVDGEKNSSHLAQQGVFCAACHLRQGQLLTPGKHSNRERHTPTKSRSPGCRRVDFAPPATNSPRVPPSMENLWKIRSMSGKTAALPRRAFPAKAVICPMVVIYSEGFTTRRQYARGSLFPFVNRAKKPY